jgi:hypothetical protein
MFFTKFSEHKKYIQGGDQMVTQGMFQGLIRPDMKLCLNPVIFPSRKLKWYISNLEKGNSMEWLKKASKDVPFPPDFHLQKLCQINIDSLIRAVNDFNQRSELPSDEELVENDFFLMNIIDETASYEIILKSFEWHEKRFELFDQANFKCSNCNKHATIEMESGVGQEASFSFVYSWDRIAVNIYNKSAIKKAVVLFKSFRLPLLELNWDYIRNYSPAEKVILQLHHTYYKIGTLPWEYPDECFKVLCKPCHEEIHQNESIPVYDSEDNCSCGIESDSYSIEQCPRCIGEGYLPQYSHVQDGICFRCWGEGYMPKMIQ